jgi:hypothetical protein
VRRLVIAVLVCVLLILAMIPWVLSGGQTQDLVPEEIRLERTRYAATVTAAQGATVEAMRESTSIVKVAPVRTLSPMITPQPTPTRDNSSSSTLIVRTVKVLDTALTPTADVDAVSDRLTPTPAPVTLSDPTNDWIIETPLGLVDAEDILTAQMLMDQFERDAEGQDLPDLNVHLSPDGIRITTYVAILPGITQQIEAEGIFLVENNSLLVSIASIVLDDHDVTKRYAGQLESRINTSLYSLLPQHFVQSVTLFEGRMLVRSKVKP